MTTSKKNPSNGSNSPELVNGKRVLNKEAKAAIAMQARERRVRKREAAQAFMQRVTADSLGAQLLTIEQVEVQYKRSRTAIYTDIKNGIFPPPVKLTARCSRWESSAVTAAIASLAARGGMQ